MSSKVYGLTENTTGRTVDLGLSTEWDDDHFLALDLTDDDGDAVVAIIIDPDKADEFFAAVATLKTEWDAR